MPESDGAPVERAASPVAPERFAILQSLLAYLLAACGENKDAVIPAHDLVERFRIPADELEEHLSLLNLVNFGGGCYAVYAELHGDEVHVDKELFGDTFRRPPRLTPLEARAIRLALEFVGPMIAAGAHSPLERVRRKLEETFGEFELSMTPEPEPGPEEGLLGTLSEAIEGNRLVEIDYMKEGESAPSSRQVEPYRISRELPHWYVHTWSRSSDGERSFRLDRIRSVRLLDETFEPRPDFEPQRFRGARTARVWYSPQVARWEVEKGARGLADGSALSERAVGSPEWLVGEMLSFRGEAEVLEPADLRKLVAKRAAGLEKVLGRRRAGSKA